MSRGRCQSNDCGGNRFAKIGVRDAKHGRFGHAGNEVKLDFNLFGIDVVTAGDDQVFATPDDMYKPALVKLTNIAGDKIT